MNKYVNKLLIFQLSSQYLTDYQCFSLLRLNHSFRKRLRMNPSFIK